MRLSGPKIDFFVEKISDELQIYVGIEGLMDV